jgi:lysophospholipase L1-like esterase
LSGVRGALVIGCILGLFVPASASAATRAAPVTPGSTYLALGDSVSFGYQPPGSAPRPDYTRASSFRGWPEHAARALHLKLVNASCPGETSASLIDPAAPSLGCENARGNRNVSYRRLFPLHVKYGGSQLSFALSFLRAHPRTRLVTLMVGANDLFLCQTTTSDGCTGAAERQAALGRIRGNVRRIVSRIRRKAHYRGRIVLMRYYSLDYNSALLSAVVRAMNRAAYQGAKPYRVRVADGYGEWRAASVHSGNNPCTAGLLAQLGEPGSCDVHPSWAGQALLAQALERAITR